MTAVKKGVFNLRGKVRLTLLGRQVAKLTSKYGDFQAGL